MIVYADSIKVEWGASGGKSGMFSLLHLMLWFNIRTRVKTALLVCVHVFSFTLNEEKFLNFFLYQTPSFSGV